MWQDVLKLRDWYKTPTGRMVVRVVRAALLPKIPEKAEVLCVGFTIPYLKSHASNSQLKVAMPAQMGAIHWPFEGANRCVLSSHHALPFADESFDYIVLTHALEFSADTAALLREVWRVLRPTGKVLVMVPNRMSPWSRVSLPLSPFAQGHPYAGPELSRLLKHHHFMPLNTSYSLFTPPSQKRFVLKLAPTFERYGQRFMPLVGGVLMMEAKKDTQAMRAQRTGAKARTDFVSVPAYSLRNRLDI